MRKGFLLYVRYNRNWTEVYGPFKSVAFTNLHEASALRPIDERAKPNSKEFAMWHVTVPVPDGEKLL